ncbi:MAG TPA: glycosyltransferase [Chryseolinea sp.]|nr:glycosyltransferase [Chryseolinea sp.]
MKVLHVLTGIDPRLGGVSQAVRTMSLGLQELGIHCEIACLDHPEELFIKNSPFKIHALGPAKGPWAYSDKLYPWLINHLTQFDTVVLHGLWQYHGYAVSKAISDLKRRQSGGRLKVPGFYVMPHGMLDPYFQRASGRRLKAIRNLIYWQLIERKVVNHADGLLFTCEEERNLAREPFRPYKPKRELVIGLGVEEPPARNSSMANAQVSKDQDFLLFLSRIHEKKGVEELLRGFSQAIKAPSSQRLIVAGPGLETRYGADMKSLVNSNRALTGSVIFPGMLAGDSKWGAFYGCEAFILPSHQENFGIAVVEALACGKPVLISDQINIWREIEQAGAGLIARDTVEGVTSLVQRWQNLSPLERKTMGDNARKLYLDSFSVRAAAERCLHAISES